MKSLKNKKSSDWDEIPVTLIKQVAHFIKHYNLNQTIWCGEVVQWNDIFFIMIVSMFRLFWVFKWSLND